MKKRQGFSLMELTMATLIFGFISISLATIYSTANRHIFQNYRSNTVKGNVSLAMRAIRNVMSQANRIDRPLLNNTYSRLVVAVNVDQSSGCYPIASAAGTATWHTFCTSNSGGNIRLFYHTGNYSNAPTCACPAACAVTNPGLNVVCGSGGGILLAQNLTTTNVFSRSWTLGDIPANNSLLVRVKLNSIWNATGANSAQRSVDYLLDSRFSVNAAGS